MCFLFLFFVFLEGGEGSSLQLMNCSLGFSMPIRVDRFVGALLMTTAQTVQTKG